MAGAGWWKERVGGDEEEGEMTGSSSIAVCSAAMQSYVCYACATEGREGVGNIMNERRAQGRGGWRNGRSLVQ